MLVFDEAMKQLQAASARADESTKRLATVMAEASVLVQRVPANYDEHTYTTSGLCRAAGISPEIFSANGVRDGLVTACEAKLGISRSGGRRPWLWSLRQVRRIVLTRCIHAGSAVGIKKARAQAEWLMEPAWRYNTLIIVFSSHFRAAIHRVEMALGPRPGRVNELSIDLPGLALEIDVALENAGGS